jgi:putative acetyltransferase
VVQIRPEQSSDHAGVEAVVEAAFGRADEARLVAVLREAVQPRVSLVAELAGRVAGHVFFSPVRIEPESAGAPAVCGLAPLAVQPGLQRQGIGAALVREGLERCADLGWRAVFVVGDPAYYSRFGFVLAAPLGFRYESEAFDSAFQVLELVPGCLARRAGRVHYDEAFTRL